MIGYILWMSQDVRRYQLTYYSLGVHLLGCSIKLIKSKVLNLTRSGQLFVPGSRRVKRTGRTGQTGQTGQISDIKILTNLAGNMSILAKFLW